MNSQFLLTMFSLVIASLGATGCGGHTFHHVSGKVSLDGQPLPGASIAFLPEHEDHPTLIGTTDQAGSYTLQWTEQLVGAPLGNYRVCISTFREGNEEANPPKPSAPERVPRCYNIESRLAREVKEQSNVFDFELSSRGAADQPLANR